TSAVVRRLRKSYICNIVLRMAAWDVLGSGQAQTRGFDAACLVDRLAVLQRRRAPEGQAGLAGSRGGGWSSGIGKIGVPDAILNKPDRLTGEEGEGRQAAARALDDGPAGRNWSR
ncbi:MAG TPA: hypothetical protein VHL09_00635, partial [Dehalococcoidia bacterium]|nr:hypothetical protein [Dehalococcoidia bacterium]